MPPLAASTPLAYQEDNPKPEDSAAYARYHKYKGAQTFEAFLQSGGTLRDLRKDKKNGYVAVDADMDGAEALVKKLTAPKSLVPWLPVWKSNFGCPSPSTRCFLRNCVCAMASRFTKVHE